MNNKVKIYSLSLIAVLGIFLVGNVAEAKTLEQTNADSFDTRVTSGFATYQNLGNGWEDGIYAVYWKVRASSTPSDSGAYQKKLYYDIVPGVSSASVNATTIETISTSTGDIYNRKATFVMTGIDYDKQLVFAYAEAPGYDPIGTSTLISTYEACSNYGTHFGTCTALGTVKTAYFRVEQHNNATITLDFPTEGGTYDPATTFANWTVSIDWWTEIWQNGDRIQVQFWKTNTPNYVVQNSENASPTNPQNPISTSDVLTPGEWQAYAELYRGSTYTIIASSSITTFTIGQVDTGGGAWVTTTTTSFDCAFATSSFWEAPGEKVVCALQQTGDWVFNLLLTPHDTSLNAFKSAFTSFKTTFPFVLFFQYTTAIDTALDETIATTTDYKISFDFPEPWGHIDVLTSSTLTDLTTSTVFEAKVFPAIRAVLWIGTGLTILGIIAL